MEAAAIDIIYARIYSLVVKVSVATLTRNEGVTDGRFVA
jgi:hypothetical protein